VEAFTRKSEGTGPESLSSIDGPQPITVQSLSGTTVEPRVGEVDGAAARDGLGCGVREMIAADGILCGVGAMAAGVGRRAWQLNSIRLTIQKNTNLRRIGYLQVGEYALALV
jgi:hypothetical protein